MLILLVIFLFKLQVFDYLVKKFNLYKLLCIHGYATGMPWVTIPALWASASTQRGPWVSAPWGWVCTGLSILLILL